MASQSKNATAKRRRVSAVDEVTPLLAASEEGPTTQANAEAFEDHGELQPKSGARTVDQGQDDEDDTPLPYGQIIVLCYVRMIDPLTFFVIFPFVSQMIFDTGTVREVDVGFWSGLIESLFSLTQMSFMLLWGWLSDRVGRKPTLVCAAFGMSLAASLFGFSQSVTQMIVFRCIAGVFSGTIVTVRTMITENSTPKTQARAFSWFAFSGNLGIFLGPLIGGALANPADQFPSLFRGTFLETYPYALPTIFTGIFGLSATLTSLLFVKETLPPRQKKPLIEENGSTNSTSNEPQQPDTLTTLQILRFPGVTPVLSVYSLVSLCALAYTAICPVFWFTPPHLGGFGFRPVQISMLLAVSGVSQALWILIVFPPLNRRLGTIGVLKLASSWAPFLYLGFPGASVLRRMGYETAFWIVVFIVMIIGSGFSMTFTGVQLALNSISPSTRSLGTLNALALMIVAGIRAVAPAAFSSIFALGVRRQILWGYFAWAFLFVMVIGLRVLVEYMPPKANGYREPKKNRVVEEESRGAGGS
ncbi:MFS general substrate transporter [Eremomyces bilateralis CBS 781.70]|uniref:MFS general substrate transporter n=1 Tax=Eremomyces bilateralis CBS 781.70 TaxID=1392243 RepID=A0A6G1G1Y1_9PEZI|nr:MFS general substrate transporter [Eremomyces bilateralis CBS 781.70]KAF1812117.1 MFS general substrate transporter [Eremomyces bilateralis CBS 781.70]